MKESDGEELATHIGPDPHADGGNVVGVASVMGTGRPAMELRNQVFRVSTRWWLWKDNMLDRVLASDSQHDGVVEPVHVWKLQTRIREIPLVFLLDGQSKASTWKGKTGEAGGRRGHPLIVSNLLQMCMRCERDLVSWSYVDGEDWGHPFNWEDGATHLTVSVELAFRCCMPMRRKIFGELVKGYCRGWNRTHLANQRLTLLVKAIRRRESSPEEGAPCLAQ